MIKCVPIPRPTTYGFAHVCDVCGAVGPIVGVWDRIVDLAETPMVCTFGPGCSARNEGWTTSEHKDVCPACAEVPEPE